MLETDIQTPLLPQVVEEPHTNKIWSYMKHGPGHLVMYTLGRFHIVRTAALAIQRILAPPRWNTETFSQDIACKDVRAAGNQLKQFGVYRNLSIRPNTLSEILHYTETALCYGEGARKYHYLESARDLAERRYGKRFSMGRYLDCTFECPAIARMMSDPALRGIARSYFDAEPILVGARMWWSYAVPASKELKATNGQTYHYDIDGYRSVSFFFYLTQTDADSGAHICVPGSHLNKPLSHLFSLHKSRTDEEIEAYYGKENIVTIEGKSGDGFGEDTFCFHKGTAPRLNHRLLLQIRFGLTDYGTGRED